MSGIPFDVFMWLYGGSWFSDALEAVTRVGGVAICATVIIGCICRIDLLKTSEHRLSWIAMYVCFGAFVAGISIDLVINRQVDWYVAAGVAGVLIYFAMTARFWRSGVPVEVKKDWKRSTEQ